MDLEQGNAIQRRRVRNYLIIFVTAGVVLLACICLVLAFAGPKEEALTEVVFFHSNDVYKLVGKPNSMETYEWKSGELSEGAIAERFRQFIDKCEGDLDESCFPMAAEDHLPNFNVRGLMQVSWLTLGSGCMSRKDYLDKWTRGPTDIAYGSLQDYGTSLKLVKELAGKHSEAVSVHAGDFLGPSYAAQTFQGDQFVQMMNHAGIDIVVPGNHDFDFGPTRFRQQVGNSTFVWLAGSMRDKGGKGEQDLPAGKLMPADSVEAVGTAQCGRKASIAGGKCTYPKSPWLEEAAHGKTGEAPYVRDVVVKEVGRKRKRRACMFGTTGPEDALAALQKFEGKEGEEQYDALHDVEEGMRILRNIHQKKYGECDVVVAITHARTGRDLKFYHQATQEGLHIDAILGGHDHYLVFLNMTYKGRNTYLIKTGADGHFLAKLAFRWNDKEKAPAAPKAVLEYVPVVQGSCREVCSDRKTRKAWPQCKEWGNWMSHLQEVYAGDVMEAAREKLAVKFAGLYDTANVRMKETRAANLWVDLYRISKDADVAIYFGGGIRQDIYITYPEGNYLSLLDVREEFPFKGNAMYVLDVPAAALLPVVEYGMHVMCGTKVDVLKLSLSGLEVIFKDSTDYGSKCELDEVKFVGAAHVEGIKDLSNKDVRGKVKSLYRDNTVQIGPGEIWRVLVPNYLVDQGGPLGGIFQLAKKVAEKGASGEEINEEQKKFLEWGTYKMKSPAYDWTKLAAQLREPSELLVIELLQDTMRNQAKEWAVSPEHEKPCEFWKSRQIPLNEVIPARGDVDNLPVFRWWNRRWLDEEDHIKEIVHSESQGEVHQSPDSKWVEEEGGPSCAKLARKSRLFVSDVRQARRLHAAAEVSAPEAFSASWNVLGLGAAEVHSAHARLAAAAAAAGAAP